MDVSGSGWEQWFLLRGDAHHDNPKCDWTLEKKHLEQAKERGAGIVDIGDLYCAMQGRWDKRANKSDLRAEHQCGDYLDALVRTAADFYEPYAANWVVQGFGNHETAIYKAHETCLINRLAAALNDRAGVPFLTGGYSGWVRFMFTINGTQCTSRDLWYTHGYGGGGPVTEDMIQSNRQRTYIKADIMLSGHVHRSWQQDYTWVALNESGNQKRNDGLYIKTGTYKDDFCDGSSGWHNEKGMGPRPLGAWWLRFYRESRDIYFTATRAK